ncbi:MAG: CPBP family intramembrane glutamic endopeptidase [Bryobacteraceae bacterium]
MRKARGDWTRYFISLLLASLAACTAAFFYSLQKGISRGMAAAVLPAFLIELAFYILPGFAGVRRSLSALPKTVLAVLLTGAAIVPYSLVTVPLGSFHILSLLAVFTIAAVIAFWYILLKPRLAADLLFLAVVAGLFLSHVFPVLYPAPTHALPLEILGRLMLVHTGVISVLCIRGLEAGFGFVPSAREWRIGFLYTLCFLPVGALLGYLLHIARWHPVVAWSWKLPLLILGRFLGVLWVVALAEEFFVRGFLQQVLSKILKSVTVGVVITSLLFGALHLPFGGFPNWRFATLAAVAGLFYGTAFAQTRTIRVPMVMHALVVTVWQLFFNSHS